MKKDCKTPHLGMIVTLGVLIAAIWMLALYDTIQEEHEKRYNVTVRPGAVSYGTHSTASVPPLVLPMQRSSAPMISGGMVRSYAHHGHATMPSAGVSSGYRMHATSSATMHSYGSGGGGGGGAVSGGSSSSPSSPTIRYRGVSVSMPSLVMAVPVRTYADNGTSVLATSSSSASSAPARHGHIRRAAPEGDGEPGARAEDNEEPGKYWYWNEQEGWVTGNDIPVGTLWNNNGSMMRWDGSEWVSSESHVSDPTKPQPLGTTPWLLIILLTCVYALGKNYVSYSNSSLKI